MASTSGAVSVTKRIDPTSDMASLLSLHSDGRVQCKKCNKFYKSKSIWQYHYYHYYRPEHPHKCNESNCEFRSPYNRDIVRHAEIMHEKLLYYCDICNKIFDDDYTLTSHALRKHSSISPPLRSEDTRIPDDVIDRANTMRRCAEEKQEINLEDIKFKCNICVRPEYKYFASINDLLFHHGDLHVTPAFPYPVCDFVSPTKTGAYNHVATHYNPTIVCHKCSTTISTRILREEHNNKCDGALFQCPKCPRRFRHFRNRSKHIKDKHRNQLSE